MTLKNELLQKNINVDFFCNDEYVNYEDTQDEIIYKLWDFKDTGLINNTVIFIVDINDPIISFWNLQYIGFPTENIITPLQYSYFNKIYDFKNKKLIDAYILNNEHIILKNLDLCKSIYNILSDEQSKKVYLNIIAKRITGCSDYNDIMSDIEHQYFDNEIVQLESNEIFVDCGAYDGDTIQSFNRLTNGNYRNIYAFEPNNDDFYKLVNSTHDLKNIIYVNAGLSDENKELNFKDLNSGSSHFINKFEQDNEKCSYKKVISGDNLKIKASFIKMDIEGYELNALKGFKNTIKNYKPKLAICIYHKDEHFWEIPLYIKQICPDYKIYIRHYNMMIFETVCYAIPK